VGIGEWTVSLKKTTLTDNSNNLKYVILGGIKKHFSSEVIIPSHIIRQPWESFEEVGFRCVKSVNIQSREQD